jgi:hypothetical protein
VPRLDGDGKLDCFTQTAVFHCAAVAWGGSTGSLLATLMAATAVDISADRIVTTSENRSRLACGSVSAGAVVAAVVPGPCRVVSSVDCPGDGVAVFRVGALAWSAPWPVSLMVDAAAAIRAAAPTITAMSSLRVVTTAS